MPEARPPFLLRLAVVVGGASLVLGLVAAVSLFVRGDEPGPVAGSGMWARVRIQGAPPGAPLEVAVSWVEEEATVTQRALRLGGHDEVWLLPECPEGALVTIRVLSTATSPPDLIATHRLEIRRGEETLLDVASAKNG